MHQLLCIFRFEALHCFSGFWDDGSQKHEISGSGTLEAAGILGNNGLCEVGNILVRAYVNDVGPWVPDDPAKQG